MVHRLLVPVALLAAVVLAVPATHAAGRDPQQYVAPDGSGALFVVTGHGYGHGVGMGQWGAEGYATHGSTYAEILASYYPGTDLAQTTVRKIRVLLADEVSTLTVSSAKEVTVVDADGASHTFAAGGTRLTTTLPYPAPLTLSPAAGAMLTLGDTYRGKLVISLVGGKLRAVNVLPLEQYVDSVVPAEMPSSWKPDALEAQAVAVRSFALAGRRAGWPYDVSVTGQTYHGPSTETSQGDAAVSATSGQVLMYSGKVATTVYSSSTGGWTESASDAWGGGAPYLVSVKDPYDNISPWHDWGQLTFTGKDLEAALGLASKPIDATVTRDSSKRVAQLGVVQRAHPDVSFTGNAVAADLNLRSSWFNVGVLSLQPPSPNVAVNAYSDVVLSGFVRGLKGVVLQQRTSGGAWTDLEDVTPDAKTGAISIDVSPPATTQYRLATAAYAAAPIRIKVK